MIRPEQRTGLHPRHRTRKVRYLLRHWRHVETWRQLLREMLRWVRLLWEHLCAWWSNRLHLPLPRTKIPQAAMLRFLHRGDVLLDAGGAELAWLERMLAHRTASLSPAVIYRADVRSTARFGYHPVETVWLLDQAGYQVWLLTPNGPIVRPESWYTPQGNDTSVPWLLAAPPGWLPPEVAR